MARASRGCGPRRPAEKCGQLANLFRIANGVRPQAVLSCRLPEESGIVVPAFVESGRLCIRIEQVSGGGVETIRLEVLYGPAARCIRVCAAVESDTRKRGAMQILRREIRPKIRAVAKYRAVLHQAVTHKYLLARHDVFARE